MKELDIRANSGLKVFEVKGKKLEKLSFDLMRFYKLDFKQMPLLDNLVVSHAGTSKVMRPMITKKGKLDRKLLLRTVERKKETKPQLNPVWS